MGLGVWQTSNSMSRQIPQIPKQRAANPFRPQKTRKKMSLRRPSSVLMFTFVEEFKEIEIPKYAV